jgi:drug/metabolite transporter (DMT)-like permease
MAVLHGALCSVQLLDCFAIFVVMALSYFLLNVRFRWHQVLVAVPMCLLGLGLLILADTKYNPSDDGMVTNHAPRAMPCHAMPSIANTCIVSDTIQATAATRCLVTYCA